MVKINDFEFAIVQRGTPVPEYLDPTAPDTHDNHTRYAEISEDNKFAIRVKCSSRFQPRGSQAVLVQIVIDGISVNGRCYPRTNFVQGQTNSFLIEGPRKVTGRKTLFQKFRFEESDTRHLQSHESLHAARETYKDQGTIKIIVSLAYGELSRGGSNIEEHPQKRYPKDIVKEKGSTSCVVHDNEESSQPFMTFAYDVREEPMATATYKYRTAEVLRDLQIIATPFIQMGIGETILIEDDDDLLTINAQLKAEVVRLRNVQPRRSVSHVLDDEVQITRDRSVRSGLFVSDDESDEFNH